MIWLVGIKYKSLEWPNGLARASRQSVRDAVRIPMTTRVAILGFNLLPSLRRTQFSCRSCVVFVFFFYGYFTLYPSLARDPPSTLAPKIIINYLRLATLANNGILLFSRLGLTVGSRARLTLPPSRDRISQNTLHIRLFHTKPPTPSSENSAVMQRHHSVHFASPFSATNPILNTSDNPPSPLFQPPASIVAPTARFHRCADSHLSLRRDSCDHTFASNDPSLFCCACSKQNAQQQCSAWWRS
jgi:hypothetical protein